MWRYRICGLDVASELELPGATPGALPLDGSDVTVRRAAVPEELGGATQHGATWAMSEDQFLLSVPGVSRFLLSAGKDIAFEAAPGVSDADLAIFLTGTVLGILLHQRGQIVLHASGVEANGKAVLFCGPSGAGKSTLAAALAEHGFPFLTDDACAIVISGSGTPMAYPDGRQLKLWAQAVERLGLNERSGERVRSSLEKFYVEPSAAVSVPLPLGAVYALRDARPPHVSGIERPNVVDAALVLRRNAYRPLLVNRMGQRADYFHAAAAIANVAGIFHLTRPLDFAAMPDVAAWLERHWLDIGLMELAA